MIRRLCALLTLMPLLGLCQQAPKPQLVQCRMIWGRAPHNAYTDLIRHNGRWYCVFREGSLAYSPDGSLRVITSADGEFWQEAAALVAPPTDLREPKLSATPDGRLLLNAIAASGTGRRSLAWLLAVQGGNAGAWFEEIPLIRSQIPSAGIVPWTSAEVTLFAVRHWLGVSFEGDDLLIRPNLFPQDRACRADLRFRASRIRLEIDHAGPVAYALVNGRKLQPRSDGSVRVPRNLLTENLQVKLFARK